jgi:excisionase family DNA binding protein
MTTSGNYKRDRVKALRTDRPDEERTMANMPEVLTVEEAAEMLRISRNTAYTLARLWRDSGGTQGLPVIELGRNLRVPRAGLQRLLNGGLGGASEATA